MSRRSRSVSANTFDVEELLQIRTRCKELRKEKDLLKDSQPQSFELIRSLEFHVNALFEAQKEDKQCILQLKRELNNCFQEIDYLQDQLNASNTEVNCLEENTNSLKLEMAKMQILEEEAARLREELKVSNLERFSLMKALESKDLELQDARLSMEKLEESISSVGLDYQCEIESIRLDLLTLEQKYLEARKSQEEMSQENSRMNILIQDLKTRLQDDKQVIKCLDKGNKNLHEKIKKLEVNAKVFCQMVERQMQSCTVEIKQCSIELEENSSACGDVLGPLVSKLVASGQSNAELKENMNKMSIEIHDHKLLVGQLKEELKEERLRAKEEAEDLAQEMAELRYQMTGLLEEEYKRRACVEQISLQRISELEAELKLEKERGNSFVLQEKGKSATTARYGNAA